jgi:hypothetical protein
MTTNARGLLVDRDAVELDIEPHARRKGHLMKRRPHATLGRIVHRGGSVPGRGDGFPDHGDPRTPPEPLR